MGLCGCAGAVDGGGCPCREAVRAGGGAPGDSGPQPITQRSDHRPVHALAGQSSREWAFERFERQVPDLPSEPTLGSRQNVILAALTLSFLEALEADGIERGYAIELTGDVCWRFYQQWGQGTRAATSLITRDPVRRLRLSVNAFLTFPFGRPGYRFDDVLQSDGRSLDMQRCPVADYLGSRGAGDLCAGSWCNLDYALAEMWGGTLERSGTLVTGASCCDFRFRVLANGEARSGATPGRALPMVSA